jgi:hypothetical protein
VSWAWKAAIIERLARLRLVIHETRAQVLPVVAGIPWLGLVVYPTHRLVKARKVRSAHRRLRSRLAAYHAGKISYAELDASIQGWINHVGNADSWGLRRHVLASHGVFPFQNSSSRLFIKCHNSAARRGNLLHPLHAHRQWHQKMSGWQEHRRPQRRRLRCPRSRP